MAERIKSCKIDLKKIHLSGLMERLGLEADFLGPPSKAMSYHHLSQPFIVAI